VGAAVPMLATRLLRPQSDVWKVGEAAVPLGITKLLRAAAYFSAAGPALSALGTAGARGFVVFGLLNAVVGLLHRLHALFHALEHLLFSLLEALAALGSARGRSALLSNCGGGGAHEGECEIKRFLHDDSFMSQLQKIGIEM
jgi:hypothetical protein